MNEQEAFEQIKAHEIEEFEETYGEEARERYGVDAIEASTARLLNMSHEEWDTKTMLEESIKEQLCQAMATRDTSSEEAQELVRIIRNGSAFTGENDTTKRLIEDWLRDICQTRASWSITIKAQGLVRLNFS